MSKHSSKVLTLSIVIPCLNEAETIAKVVEKSLFSIKELNVEGEVIVADNGSTDDSKSIASNLGANIVEVATKGYGAALMGGFKSARGKYVVMGDADDSYSLDNLGGFIEKLDAGFDLVMGNRFMGGIEKGAMPWLHKYLGNPVLSWIGRLFFQIRIHDFHCGLRAFRRESILALDLRSKGMEFASEMVVKAALNHLKIAEIPTRLSKDGRSRKPHLRTWRDGWRHLIFLLAASPRFLFLYPGFFFLALGVAGILLSRGRTVNLSSNETNVTVMLISVSLVILGMQNLLTAILVKVFATYHRLLPLTKNAARFGRIFTLERGMVLGLFMISASILLLIAFHGTVWLGFALDFIFMILLITGTQILFASFFASILQT